MKEMIKNPVSWAVGGVASFFGVLGVMLSDPSMSIMVILQVFVENASTLFTAASIAGFTLAPEVSDKLARAIQLIAFAAGTVIVLRLAGQFWDKIKENLVE